MSFHNAVLVPAISQGVQTAGYLGGGTYIGVPQAAASLYSRIGDKQSILYSVSGFNGNIDIQTTLSTNPADSEWTTVFSITETDANAVYVIAGNYTYIRAVVTDFAAGTINNIRVIY